MILYTEPVNEDPSKKITDTDLQTFANTIIQFTNVYYKNIFVESEEAKMALINIRDIAFLIKQRRYNELFDNPNVIDFSEILEDNVVITEEDRKNWDSFFANNPY